DAAPEAGDDRRGLLRVDDSAADGHRRRVFPGVPQLLRNRGHRPGGRRAGLVGPLCVTGPGRGGVGGGSLARPSSVLPCQPDTGRRLVVERVVGVQVGADNLLRYTIGGAAMARRAKQPEGGGSIPAKVRPAHDAIVVLTDAFCPEHLDDEYQALCRRLAGVLARKRPSPLTRGKPEVWACAIVRVIGWVNFLDDSSQTPHLKLTGIDQAFGVAESTGQAKAKAIRDLLKIRPLD